MAVEQLQNHGIPVIALGLQEGKIGDVPILTSWPESIPDLDTITLYINPYNQQPIADKILGLRPRRIIFNPGTENPGLIAKAREQGIEVLSACTLVLLTTGAYEDA